MSVTTDDLSWILTSVKNEPDFADFNVDHVYLTEESVVQELLPSNGFIVDGSFEIPTDSGLFALTGWKTTLTGSPASEFGTLETITAPDSPHGGSYIKLTGSIDYSL